MAQLTREPSALVLTGIQVTREPSGYAECVVRPWVAQLTREPSVGVLATQLTKRARTEADADAEGM